MDTIDLKIVDAEKRFLSYLLYDKRFIAESMSNMKAEYFPNYRDIYKMIISYFNRFKDVITENMVEIYFKNKNIDDNTITNYKILVAELRSNNNFNNGEFKALSDQLIKYYKRKALLKIAESIVNTNPMECNDSGLKELETIIKSDVIKLTADQVNIRKEGLIEDSAKNRLEHYEEIKEHPEILNFTKTGFKHMDDVNGGLREGELIYVIGRKGDGKSVFLLNLAHSMWESGKNVIIFSLEIPKADYERRFDSLASEVNSNGLKMGNMSEDEEERYNQYIKMQQQGKTLDGKISGKLFIVDSAPGITPTFVNAKTDIIEQQLGVKFDVIITDYAGIMRPSIPVAEKRLQQSNIALELKSIARERECIVISAAQKNRTGAKEKGADSAFIAESDGVADHLDWGFDIMSTSDENGTIQTFKARDGEQVKFSFRKKYNIFKILEMSGTPEDAWDQLT